MRIGIYKDTLANRRGADMAVLALAEGLCERGHDAAVFEKPDLERCVAEPWDVMISTGTNELLDLYAWFMANPTPTPPTPTLNSNSSPFPWPVIQQFHTNPKSQFKWKRIFRNWKIKRALGRVSAIQVLSEEFVPQVKKYGIPVHVIGNWSRFGEMKKDGAMGEKLVGDISSSSRMDGLFHSPTPTQYSNSLTPTIIYPAAFAKGKNQKLLIKAFAKTSAEFPGWKLRLLGHAEGRYADECRFLAEKLGNGRIGFAGFCEDMAAEYERCAFVAFPSLDEGFSLTLADAAAYCKPCVMVKDWIGTGSGGELEFGVGVGGEEQWVSGGVCEWVSGGIVTKPTVEAYADGLRRLMADAELRRRMGERAREFCAEYYSRKRILDQWERMLSETVSRRFVGAPMPAGL